MNLAHIEPDGRVRLPSALASFFSVGERVEVTQHRWHLALWRAWGRSRTHEVSDRQRIARATDYEQAAQRYRRLSCDLRDRDVQTAMYLSGFAIECLLKRMICESYGFSSLERAEYEYARECGYEPGITGTHGHDLLVLAEAARLWSTITGDRWVYKRFLEVNQWQVSWRYRLPDHMRRSAKDFLTAFDGLWQWFIERSTQHG